MQPRAARASAQRAGSHRAGGGTVPLRRRRKSPAPTRTAHDWRALRHRARRRAGRKNVDNVRAAALAPSRWARQPTPRGQAYVLPTRRRPRTSHSPHGPGSRIRGSLGSDAIDFAGGINLAEVDPHHDQICRPGGQALFPHLLLRIEFQRIDRGVPRHRGDESAHAITQRFTIAFE